MADFVDFDVEDGCPVDVDMRNLVELLEDDEEFQEYIDNLPSDVSIFLCISQTHDKFLITTICNKHF